MNRHVAFSNSNQNCQDVQRAKYLARIIKSRRLQQRRTLEDVSYGVCSGSYLSKIENCSVDVDDIYYKSLLEKVEVDYDNINLNYESRHLRKSLHYLVHMSYEGIVEVASKIDNSEIFHEIECEITSLMIHTYQEKFTKCEENIKRLEHLKNTMLEDEFLIFTIAHSFYLYHTNRLNLALEKIQSILVNRYLDEEIKLAVEHILSLVYFSKGEMIEAYLHSKEIDNNSHLLPDSQRITANLIFNRLMRSREIPSKEIEAYDEISFSDFPSELKEHCQFHICFAFYHCGYHLTAYTRMKQYEVSRRIIALMASLYHKLTLDFAKAHIRDVVETYEFTTKDSLFYHYVQAIKMNWKRMEPLEIMSYMKDNIFSKIPEQFEFWLIEEAKQLFLDLCYKAGKYKEGCRMMLENIVK